MPQKKQKTSSPYTVLKTDSGIKILNKETNEITDTPYQQPKKQMSPLEAMMMAQYFPDMGDAKTPTPQKKATEPNNPYYLDFMD